MKKRLQLTSTRSLNLSHNEGLNHLLGSVVKDVKEYADRLHSQIRKLSDIGRALSGVYDLNDLLEMIVDQARNFTHADAGTLYIKKGDQLEFKIFQNDSLNIRMGGKTGEKIPFNPVELKETNVSAFVALNGISVNIPDVYNTALFDFVGPKEFDRSTGYRTKSMLVVLMRNHENDVLGVLQLLNAKDPETGEVTAFSPECENLTECLASQAAIAISNVQLVNDMENLFEAFLKVMATAIDEKSPVTGGHIRRVASLTLTIAEVIHAKNEGAFKDRFFDADAMHELRIAAWMHDIGKVTSPMEIMDKSRKLQTIFDRIEHVDLRMSCIQERIKNAGLKKKIKAMQAVTPTAELRKIEEEIAIQVQEIADIRDFIRRCNEPGETLEDSCIEKLNTIAQRTYFDAKGEEKPYLEADELEYLSIRRGTISEAEREKMREHAHVTLKMLEQIPFTKKLKNIPHFAAAHHECINGTGYPLGLKGDEIPFEGKMMAVVDIAEALTAADRPYKKSMTLDMVHKILRTRAERGELDCDLVELFIEEEVYKKFLEKYETQTREPARKGEVNGSKSTASAPPQRVGLLMPGNS